MTSAASIDGGVLSPDLCTDLVRGGSFGKIAYWDSDNRVVQAATRYVIDMGTGVCAIDTAGIDAGRLVPVAFEGFGCDDEGLMWCVVIHARARRVTRDSDLERLHKAGLPPLEKAQSAIRVMADTLHGTRSSSPPPLPVPLIPDRKLTRVRQLPD